MHNITRIKSIWLPLLLMAVVVSGCSSFGKEKDPTRGWSAQRLFSEAKALLAENDFEGAIDMYQKLESRYPFGNFAQQAQIDVAFAYYKNNEPASAIAAADRFIKLHPRHPNVDYAYYLKGLVSYNQGKSFMDRFIPKDRSMRDPGASKDAFDAFSELVRRFPDSKYADDATTRMLQLKNTLAWHELHVAQYYMRRNAYLAAANRARYVVENFQGAPAVHEALVVMVKAYRKMELPELANDALRVLKLNAPQHEAIAGLEKTG